MALPMTPSLLLRSSERAGTGSEDEFVSGLEELHERVTRCRDDIVAALELARDVGRQLPNPGTGATADLWSQHATIAAADVQTARVVEPHVDALGILAEAAQDGIGVDLESVGAGEQYSANSQTWGVFAAESANHRLLAAEDDRGIFLTGTKPWCSLASQLSHALVTAHTSTGGRALFAVNLTDPRVTTHDGVWVARGMAQVPSCPVDFDGVPAVRVGADGWYLNRPGFWWGGLGVAAIWWGGAVGLARIMRTAASGADHREPDQLTFAHLGAVDAALIAARAVLIDAADRIDDRVAPAARGAEPSENPRLLAARGRSVAAWATDIVLSRSVRSLGPSSLALDPQFARQHADLALYVRQHHAERDDAALGRLVAAGDQDGGPGW